MEKILVTGSSGLVGSRFVELHKNKNELLLSRKSELNITNSDLVKTYFNKHDIKTVIHFAAHTDVGKAEEQRNNKSGSCWKINVQGTKNLFASTNSDSHFIYISTDMVFPGSKNDPGPYFEDHKLSPRNSKLTWYGYTKAMGEQEVAKSIHKNTTILRINYPVRAHFSGKQDYLKKHLELFNQNKLYPLFNDQQISISYIDEVCKALEKIIANKYTGIFHASSSNTTSPYELISCLIKKTGGDEKTIKKSSLDDFLKTADNPTRYPKYGGLKVIKTQNKLGIKFSTTKQIIDQLSSKY